MIAQDKEVNKIGSNLIAIIIKVTGRIVPISTVMTETGIIRIGSDLIAAIIKWTGHIVRIGTETGTILEIAI
jgi:hypothetical protein